MMITSLAALFAAGVLTFASPCVLPLLPVYVGILGGSAVSGGAHDPAAARRVRSAGIGFALGLAIVFVVLGVGASALAAKLADHRRGLQIAAAIAMALFAAKLLGVFRARALDADVRPFLERVPAPNGIGGGVLFGMAFGVGWTPCVGPVLGAALTYAAATSASPWRAGLQLGAYAAGLAAPLVVAAFAAPRVLAIAKRARGATPALQKVMGGALLVVAGLLAFDRLGGIANGTTSASGPCADPAEAGTCGADLQGAAPAARGLAGRPRVVEFVSAHCPVCERMKPIVSAIAARCSAHEDLVPVSIDDADGRALANRYGVRVVPTFVAVDAGGNEVERWVGAQSEARLATAVAEVRGEACSAM